MEDFHHSLMGAAGVGRHRCWSPSESGKQTKSNVSGFNYRSKSASFLGDSVLSPIVARQQRCPAQPSECHLPLPITSI